MSIPLATQNTLDDSSSYASAVSQVMPFGMTCPNPAIPRSLVSIPEVAGPLVIPIIMKDASESSREVSRENSARAPVWNGREIAHLRNEPIAFDRKPSFQFLLLFFTLAGLSMGITGTIYVVSNIDPADNDNHSQYLKRIGIILFSVGWLFCCCCGILNVANYRAQSVVQRMH